MAKAYCGMNAHIRGPIYGWERTLYVTTTHVRWNRTGDVDIAHTLCRTKIVYLD